MPFKGRSELSLPLPDGADSGRFNSREWILLEQSSELVLVIDDRGLVILVGPTQEKILGFARTRFAECAFSDLVAPAEVEKARLYMTDLLTGQSENGVTGLFHLIDSSGVSRPMEVTGKNYISSESVAGIVLTLRDISEEIALRSQIEIQSKELHDRGEYDPLTGLLSHRAFQKCLREEMRRSEFRGEPLTVVLFDLKNFGFINDAHGHEVGDELLKIVGTQLLNEVDLAHFGLIADEVTIARYGGDDFAMILPRVDVECAADVPAVIHRALSSFGFEPKGDNMRIPLSCSIGVAVYPSDSRNRADLIAFANERMKRSKSEQPENKEVERVRRRLRAASEGFSVLDALLTATDNKDRYTRRHSEDVMVFSLMIADELALSDELHRTLEEAALLHDVGKIGIPDSILRKPGRLTDIEFEAMKQHPTIGTMMVGAIPSFHATLDGINFHHERWDGLGYPIGLTSTDIPMIARVIAVADAFSAMTTDRPYRIGMEDKLALGILKSGSGTQWDPACVAAFLRAQESLGISPG